MHTSTYEPRECSLCLEGEQWLAGACHDCDVGTSKGLGNMVCSACPAGYANIATAQSKCVDQRPIFPFSHSYLSRFLKDLDDGSC